MLDSDLAELYQITVKRLNEQVRRNLERFPPDFAFQLHENEWELLKSYFETLREPRRGEHRKFFPYAFTQEGVAMLSGVLNSPVAIQVNIEIMRAFVKMKNSESENQSIWLKIEQMEKSTMQISQMYLKQSEN